MMRVPSCVWKWMTLSMWGMWTFMLVAFAIGNADRSSPYDFTAPTPTPAIAGGYVAIRFDIRPDVDRDCSRSTSREIIDADGVHFPLPFEASEAPRDVDGRLDMYSVTRLFQVPSTAAQGAARYRSTSQYVCNPTQRLWPIESIIEVPFFIL